MTEPMQKADIDWSKILPEPFVTLLLGARGEGKTALGHRLLEVFHGEERDAYIMGFPEEKSHLLPDWIQPLPPTTSRSEWPENSIVLIHEAHMLLHARRSMDVENLELDELVSVSRHKDSDIVYDTQQSQRLDRNAVAAVDGIIARWPALMQEDFERKQVRDIVSDARDALSDYVRVHDDDGFTYVERMENDNGVDLLHKHAFVHADRFRGEYPHEIELPDHWSEDISTAYGDTEEMAAEEDDDEDGEEETDPLETAMQKEAYRDLFERALQYENSHSKGWMSTDVGASGGHISYLLQTGIIDYSYRSGSTKRFELTNPSRVKRLLDEYDD